ncbi:hypothetical protein CJF24_22025 [Aeromonas veronii]|uniref:Uncharacterized protein n=3 Tax=Aeromonadaceae TaxID=84642 RepID=A0ABY3MFH7_AERVE|nr:hypothetical protein CJF24_22025 [Aeromonas veronii]
MAVILGAGGSTWGVAAYLANEITGQLTELQSLNQQISTAQRTLDSLPKGVTFVRDRDGRYIVARQIDTPFKMDEGTYKGLMAVGVK